MTDGDVQPEPGLVDIPPEAIVNQETIISGGVMGEFHLKSNPDTSDSPYIRVTDTRKGDAVRLSLSVTTDENNAGVLATLEPQTARTIASDLEEYADSVEGSDE